MIPRLKNLETYGRTAEQKIQRETEKRHPHDFGNGIRTRDLDQQCWLPLLCRLLCERGDAFVFIQFAAGRVSTKHAEKKRTEWRRATAER